eukprot:scaffold5696_cov119-Isochrysis_galbana.AAC.15
MLEASSRQGGKQGCSPQQLRRLGFLGCAVGRVGRVGPWAVRARARAWRRLWRRGGGPSATLRAL